MAIDEFEVEEANAVVYVKKLGTEIDGMNIYHIYVSDKPEEVFAEGWGDMPACVVPRKLIDGDNIENVEQMFAKRDITVKYIK